MKAGRKWKLNRTVIKTLVKAKAGGLPDNKAIALAGIHADTFYTWKRQGDQDLGQGKKTKQAELSYELAYLEAQRVQESLTRIEQAAQGGQTVEETTTVTEVNGVKT